LKIWRDPYIYTRKITEFLLQSDEKNEKFVLPKNNKGKIHRLIEFLENSTDDGWQSIRSGFLFKKKQNTDFEQLEIFGKKHYEIVASKFYHLKNEIIQAKEINSDKKPPPFDVLQNKIKKTINIWKDSKFQEDKNNFDFFKNNFGPVIFITFSSIESCDPNDYLSPIKKSMSEAYQQHLYLYRKFLIECIGCFKYDVTESEKNFLNTKNVDIKELINNLQSLIAKYNPTFKNYPKYQDLEAFQRICFDNGKAATEMDLIYSIHFLSKLLHQNFDKKVFVLIDEYDAPLNSLVGNPVALDNALNLFREGLKNNKYLEKSITTGILSITKASLFS